MRQRDLAMTAVDATEHPYSRTVALAFAAILAMERADVAGFRRHAAALEAHAVDDAPAQVRLPMRLFAARLEVLEGRTEAGLARLREVRESLVRGEAPAPGLPAVATRMLLEAYERSGEPERGLALAGEALGMGRGAELWEAEIRRLRATFLSALGAGDDEVEAELGRALAVARRQSARAFERRIRETLEERARRHDRVG